MIIKTLTLHNVGLYAGTNTFEFSTEKAVTLIGGMNGHGKTTFLESILLVLYGRRSFAFSESKLSYKAYLKKLVNAADGTLQSYIELVFAAGNDIGKREFVLRREWSAKNKDVTDSISVIKDGITDTFLSDNWAMYIEELLPSAISNFFFFDGEKISELAVESTGEQMRNSIKTLLGIDVLDRLETDLKKILTSRGKKLASSENFKRIEELRETEALLNKQIETVQRDITETNTFNDKYRRQIDKLEAQFMEKGGQIGNDKSALLARKSRLEDELNNANEQLMELVEVELPLALVEPLLQSVYKAASSEQAVKHEAFANQRIKQLIELFRQGTKSVNKQMESFIAFVESEFNNNVLKDDISYDLSENAIYQAKQLSNSFLHDKKREASDLQARRLRIREELDEVENYLMIEVDEGLTKSIYSEIMSIYEEIGANNEKKQKLTTEETTLNVKYMQVQRELTKLIEKSLTELENMDDEVRIVRYANTALRMVAAYRLRLQERKTTVLAETMTDCYKKIVNKKNLIGNIEIDNQTLDFIYYDSKGEVVDKKRLSAGEKQLMVVAMLWSLALCSHNKLPVIIDTPLARLDLAHRERMVKAYFPNASEQTIILSTDAEIDSRYYKLLKPSIGKEFTLMYNDKAKRTTIADGYFGGGTI